MPFLQLPQIVPKKTVPPCVPICCSLLLCVFRSGSTCRTCLITAGMVVLEHPQCLALCLAHSCCSINQKQNHSQLVWLQWPGALASQCFSGSANRGGDHGHCVLVDKKPGAGTLFSTHSAESQKDTRHGLGHRPPCEDQLGRSAPLKCQPHGDTAVETHGVAGVEGAPKPCPLSSPCRSSENPLWTSVVCCDGIATHMLAAEGNMGWLLG